MNIEESDRMAEIEEVSHRVIARQFRDRILCDGFDRSPIPMAIINGKEYLVINDSFCTLLGFSRAEVEGHAWRQFVAAEDLGKTEVAAHRMSIGPLIRFVNRLITKDGRYIEVEWWATGWEEGLTYAIARPT